MMAFHFDDIVLIIWTHWNRISNGYGTAFDVIKLVADGKSAILLILSDLLVTFDNGSILLDHL